MRGILLRKVSYNNLSNQLGFLLRGSSIVLLLYVINEFYIQESRNFTSFMTLAGIFIFLLAMFLVLTYLRKNVRDEELLKEIYHDFNLAHFDEVRKLDRELVNQIKHDKKFVSNNSQIIGTTDYLLVDKRDGFFSLLPINQIQKADVAQEGKIYVVVFQLEKYEKKIPFKNRKDANELYNTFNDFYLKAAS